MVVGCSLPTNLQPNNLQLIDKMKDIFNVQVSVYAGVTDTVGKVTTIRQFLEDRSHDADIQRIRQEPDSEKQNVLKRVLPAATLSGWFAPSRSAGNLIKHSGFIAVDIDGKENPDFDMEALKQTLARCRNIAYIALSVRGEGLFCLIPISAPSKHKGHFRALQEDFKRMGITIDNACKDVSRMRVISYDPAPHENQAAVPFSRIIEEHSMPKSTFYSYRGEDTTLQDVEKLVATCERSHLDITEGYGNWFRIGAALASLGENGRDFFHRLSALNSDYRERECDRKFDNLLRTCGRVGIGTLFYIAETNGIIMEKRI